MNTKIALGLLTAVSVVGMILGGKTVYNRYNKTINLWKDRFYEKLTQDDIAWG